MSAFTPKKFKSQDARKLAYTPKTVKKVVKDYVKAQVNRMTETHCNSGLAPYADLEAASQRIIHVTNIAQGEDIHERKGDVIAPTKFQAKIAIRLKGVTGVVNVRTMLVKAKQCDGTAPALVDILTQANSNIAYLPVDMGKGDVDYEREQSKRKFSILYDKTIQLAKATDDGHKLFRLLSITKKLSGKIIYKGSLGTDEGNNQYYLFIHTDAADDKVEVMTSYRIFYKDM